MIFLSLYSNALFNAAKYCLVSRQTLPYAHCDGSLSSLFRNRLLEFLTIYRGHMLTITCQNLDKAWILPPNAEG